MQNTPKLIHLANAAMALVLLLFIWFLPKFIELGWVVHPVYAYSSSIFKLCLLYGISRLRKGFLYMFVVLHIIELSLIVLASEWFTGASFSQENLILSSIFPTIVVVTCAIYYKNFYVTKDH